VSEIFQINFYLRLTGRGLVFKAKIYDPIHRSYGEIFSASFVATFSPSIAALTIPPAYPAPSAQG
jgi:hypothetical protein